MPKCQRCGTEGEVQAGFAGLGPRLCTHCLDEVQRVAKREPGR